MNDFDANSKEADHLRRRAGLLNLSHRDRLCVVGKDRIRFLNGQLTNNIRDLSIGSGCYALAVNRKGIVEGEARVFCLDKEILLELETGQGTTMSERLNRFLIADEVEVFDVRESFKLLSVQGPLSHSAISFLNFPKETLPFTNFDIRLISQKSGEVYVARHSRTGTVGYDFFIDKALFGEWKTMLKDAVMKVNGGLCGEVSLETLRIENGIPRYPNEMTPSVLAPELGGEDRFISYKKGCYIGQEVINRIKSIGKLNRRLAGLMFEKNADEVFEKYEYEKAENEKYEVFENEVFENGKGVGRVTSLTFSEPLGRVIGLAMLKMRSSQIGKKLEVMFSKRSQSSKLSQRSQSSQLSERSESSKPIRAKVVEIPFSIPL